MPACQCPSLSFDYAYTYLTVFSMSPRLYSFSNSYALYDQYGYSQHLIAVLFVAGFGSSMVFGSFIGGMADACGRRKFVILFAVIYALSCMTKHYKNFHILMLGRLLGGIATSLLFSVFDSWRNISGGDLVGPMVIRREVDLHLQRKKRGASKVAVRAIVCSKRRG